MLVSNNLLRQKNGTSIDGRGRFYWKYVTKNEMIAFL